MYQLRRTDCGQMSYEQILEELNGIFEFEELYRSKKGKDFSTPGAIMDRVQALLKAKALHDFSALCDAFDDLVLNPQPRRRDEWPSLDLRLIPKLWEVRQAGEITPLDIAHAEYALDIAAERHEFEVKPKKLHVERGRIWFELKLRKLGR